MDPIFPLAELATIRASRWTLLMARLFGRKIGSNDTITFRVWRGKVYIDWP